MARLYANENFPLPVVEVLRHLGHDVLTTAESGRGGQAIPDAEVLAFAIGEQRAVLTLNRLHFIRLHHTVPEHAGIVVCTFDPDFAVFAQPIHDALEAEPRGNWFVSTAPLCKAISLCFFSTSRGNVKQALARNSLQPP